MSQIARYLAEIGRRGGKASGALKTSAQMAAIASLPRKPNAARCPCGAMTSKRAKARGHKCEGV